MVRSEFASRQLTTKRPLGILPSAAAMAGWFSAGAGDGV
jgi:hypothetical protein